MPSCHVSGSAMGATALYRGLSVENMVMAGAGLMLEGRVAMEV